MAEDDFPALGAAPPAGKQKKQKAKNQKVSLDAFMADQNFGSWADEMDTIPTAPMAREQGTAGTWGAGGRRPPDGGQRDYGAGAFGRDADRPMRAEIPLPTEAPFIAYVGNLSFEATETDITDLFAPLNANITSIRLVMGHDGRSKGMAYVEFTTLDELKAALGLSGESMGGRSVRVSVAEPRRQQEDRSGASEWRRDGPLPPLSGGPQTGGRGFERTNSSENADWSSARGSKFEPTEAPAAGGFNRRNFSSTSSRSNSYANLGASDGFGEDGLDRAGFGARFVPTPAGSGEGSRRNSTFGGGLPPPVGEADTASTWRRAAPLPATPSSPGSSDKSPQPSHPPSPAVRRKLDLAPRSTTSPTNVDEAAPASASSTKPNPFGDAKPVNTAERAQSIDEKRAKAQVEKLQKDELAKSNTSRSSSADPFGAAKPVDTNSRMQEIESRLEQQRKNAAQRPTSPPASPKHSRQSSVNTKEVPTAPAAMRTSQYAQKALRKDGFSFANAASGSKTRPANGSAQNGSVDDASVASEPQNDDVQQVTNGTDALQLDNTSEKDTTA